MCQLIIALLIGRIIITLNFDWHVLKNIRGPFAKVSSYDWFDIFSLDISYILMRYHNTFRHLTVAFMLWKFDRVKWIFSRLKLINRIFNLLLTHLHLFSPFKIPLIITGPIIFRAFELRRVVEWLKAIFQLIWLVLPLDEWELAVDILNHPDRVFGLLDGILLHRAHRRVCWYLTGVILLRLILLLPKGIGHSILNIKPLTAAFLFWHSFTDYFAFIHSRISFPRALYWNLDG